MNNDLDAKDYRLLLEQLMEETRRLLVKVKKEKHCDIKMKVKESLFDEFIYINSLRNSAKNMHDYKEAYEVLQMKIKEFHNQIA